MVPMDRPHTRRVQRQSSQHQRMLNRGSSHMESILSQLSSLRREPQGKRPKSSLAQHPNLNSIMLSLMLMRSSLYCAVSQLDSTVPAKISEKALTFLLDEFEQLVAFGHEASALRSRQRFSDGDTDEESLLRLTTSTSTSRNYSLEVDHISTVNTTSRKQSRTLYHRNMLGLLALEFEEKIGNHNGVPINMLNASFRFAPKNNIHKTGVFASFQKEV